jgi:hypothetical protein
MNHEVQEYLINTTAISSICSMHASRASCLDARSSREGTFEFHHSSRDFVAHSSMALVMVASYTGTMSGSCCFGGGGSGCGCAA